VRPRCAPTQARPAVEGLEDRQLLSTTTISGFVFADSNNNGLFDSNETPISGNTLQLFRGSTAAGTPIASATTDANGFYQFSADATVSTAPTTRTVVATFANAKTGWTKTAQVAQFDPSLGTLVSVDVVNNATMQSEFQFENLDNEPGTIDGTITGGVAVTVPGAGVLTAPLSASDSFNAGADDGTIDFSGPGGHDSGLQNTSGSQSMTVTDAGLLQQFEGTGSVTLSAHATARSSVSGPGNVLALLSASAGANVQVVYHYVPSNTLQPGTYTILQTSTPPGYIPGLKSSGGQVIPNSANVNTITVTLQNGNSTNNDFGELKSSSLSGYVYVDLSKSGARQSNDPPIPGTTITLTGTNDLGAAVSLVVQTDTTGFYHFDNLRPGSYTITETQPAGYLEGTNSLGTLNGTPSGTVGSNDQFFVTVAQAQTGRDYDFGELLPPSPPQVTPPQAPPTPVLSKLLFLSSSLRFLR
jgi:hypothetical protein